MKTPTDALRLVPVDTGPNFSDSSLPFDMIYAGADAIDRATDDMANYVSGKTIDWDSGMTAVAVYRAMLSAAPASPLPDGGGPTCQTCGGKIEAWTCQGCGAQFHENDAGSLVLGMATPGPAGQCSGISGELSGWQDISTAPRQERVMLAHKDFKGWFCLAICNALGDWSYDDRPWGQQDSPDKEATHWMPLPAAPTGAK